MQVATEVRPTIGALVAEVLAARDRCDEAAAALKELGAKCDRLEEELSDLMNDEGCQSFKAADGRQVYKSRDLQVNVPAANREQVVEACRLLGLDDLIKTEVPTASLKSHVREWLGELGDKEQIPEQLRPLIAVHESYSIRVRKS